MKTLWKATYAAALTLVLVLNGSGQSFDDIQRFAPGAIGDGVVSYIYGYPLMMLGVTGRTGTTVPNTTTKLGAAPLNQFGPERVLPNASFDTVVLPSTSTLYASAFLNLCPEPLILHIPSLGSRFFLLQMLDGWTEVSPLSPGSDKATQEGDYALVGPNCTSQNPPEIPPNVRGTIPFPTSSGWIIGRIYTDGSDADIQYVVNNIYPGLTLTPLSQYVPGQKYMPPQQLPVQPYADVVTTPLHQVSGMDACAFFQNLAAMMRYNLPIEGQDDAVLPSLLRMGLVVRNNDPAKGSVPITGTNFDCTNLRPERLSFLQRSIVLAEKLMETVPSTRPTSTGWTVSLDVGTYGRRYLLRAVVAKEALGANRKEDAVYGYTQTDGNGTALSGRRNYKIHFEKQGANLGIPPVNPGGFWSLTIYDADGKLVQSPDPASANWNAVGVPEIQQHQPCFNNDGSLDLYLQATEPPKGTQQFCNWLPTPAKGGYIAFLRMYWPDASILSGDWIPPAIVKN